MSTTRTATAWSGAAGGRVYALGDAVRVRVERVNVPLGEINFELLPPKAEPEPGD